MVVKDLSPTQIVKLRRPANKPPTKKLLAHYFPNSQSGEVTNYCALRFNETSLSTYGTQVVAVNAHLLRYAVQILDFKIVLSLYMYSQKPFLKDFMEYNRVRRVECLEKDDVVGSNSCNVTMNGCFGGFGVNPSRASLKILQDYTKE